MASPILVTGAAGRVGAVGRTVTELLLKQGKAVRWCEMKTNAAQEDCAREFFCAVNRSLMWAA